MIACLIVMYVLAANDFVIPVGCWVVAWIGAVLSTLWAVIKHLIIELNNPNNE